VILMEGLLELIEAATRYLDSRPAAAAFPWTEFAALFIALVAVISPVITTIYKGQKDRERQNANVKIEWIREVRKLVAELIDACLRVIHYRTQEAKREATNKIELLILHFDYDGEDLYKDVDLLGKTSNDGKNDKIVDFLRGVGENVWEFCDAEKYDEALADNIVYNVPALRNIMRIYLKIEWEKAKKGE